MGFYGNATYYLPNGIAQSVVDGAIVTASLKDKAVTPEKLDRKYLEHKGIAVDVNNFEELLNFCINFPEGTIQRFQLVSAIEYNNNTYPNLDPHTINLESGYYFMIRESMWRYLLDLNKGKFYQFQIESPERHAIKPTQLDSENIKKLSLLGGSNGNIALETITGGYGDEKGNIARNTITSYNIKDEAITTDKLATNVVTESKIANNAILADHIKDQAITRNKLATSSVYGANVTGASSRIMEESIAGGKGKDIALDTITGGSAAGEGNIAGNTITSYNVDNSIMKLYYYNVTIDTTLETLYNVLHDQPTGTIVCFSIPSTFKLGNLSTGSYYAYKVQPLRKDVNEWILNNVWTNEYWRIAYVGTSLRITPISANNWIITEEFSSMLSETRGMLDLDNLTKYCLPVYSTSKIKQIEFNYQENFSSQCHADFYITRDNLTVGQPVIKCQYSGTIFIQKNNQNMHVAEPVGQDRIIYRAPSLTEDLNRIYFHIEWEPGCYDGAKDTLICKIMTCEM